MCVCLLRGHTFLPKFIVILIIMGNTGFNTIFILFILFVYCLQELDTARFMRFTQSIDMVGVIQGNVIIMSWLY